MIKDTPIRVVNDSTNETRELYWDEENQLMVLSDNGKTSRYTYNAAGERIMKSYGTMEGVYINGAPQGITFHETDNFTLYPASILSVNKNRFTKHYFIGDKRIASRIGTGLFNNVYGRNGSYVTAGQQDYAERMNQIQTQKEAYYKKMGVAPGVPTEKGAYGDPENTGVGYNAVLTELGNHDVPQGWIQTPRPNTTPGTNPGAPVSWNDPSNPDDPQAGYGYIPNDTTKEETFFYHSDYLGSTSYITDDKANITQYDAYLPYGELLVDEHSSSEELPYKFNGKQFDEETGLYYYGARYMNPVTSLWYGVDPLAEKFPLISVYSYCTGNPVKFVDLDGNFPILINGKVSSDTERGNYMYWDKNVREIIKQRTGYYHSQFQYVDGDKGLWPSTRIQAGYEQGKKDAAKMYAILKRSVVEGKITEQIQLFSHSRGSAFASGYMISLVAGIKKLTAHDHLGFSYGSDNIIEYSVNLAPHQSNYINYEQSGSINVNVSHYGDLLSGNDATGNVINIHSYPEVPSMDQHGNKSYSMELNEILKILENGGTKNKIKQNLSKMYREWDRKHSTGGHSSVK